MLRKIQTTMVESMKRSVTYDLKPAIELWRQSCCLEEQEDTQVSHCSEKQKDNVESPNGQNCISKETAECPINDITTTNNSTSSPLAPIKGKLIRLGLRCPTDFKITDELLAWAQEETSLDAAAIDFESKQFRDWEFKVPRSDWQAAWRFWMRRADKYFRERGIIAGAGNTKRLGSGNLGSQQNSLRDYMDSLDADGAES
jgi:hypothetical protein